VSIPIEGRGTDAAAAGIRIVSGDPTDAEIAAVTAVITATLQELADDGLRDAPEPVSAWQRSRRPVRSPITRGAGAWRGFSG
jgi:hypothetical protein